MSEVRVRFAPSPTGNLHIGGVRTALFNWLYARHHGGKFLLRIEDTDTKRSEEKYTKDILASLEWLGLDLDEEIFHQSKRTEIYKKATDELVAAGMAYHCTCTADEIDKMREEARATGRKPRYSGKCRSGCESGKPFVVRAKLPDAGDIVFEDLIRGKITVSNSELDDFIISRSDGNPTYHLVVVVDDIESDISHVIRGEDHINNTPKQIHLYEGFKTAGRQVKIPKYAHLSMILGPDKKKLSKRHGHVSAIEYRKDGYLAEALMNFLVRLGWSHGDQEIFSKDEMVKFFDFDNVQKPAAVLNPEKLTWLNGHYLREISSEALRDILLRDFSDQFSSGEISKLNSDLVVKLIKLIKEKIKMVPEVVEQLKPLLDSEPVEVDSSKLKWNKKPELKVKTLAGIEEIRKEFAAAIGASTTLGEAGFDHDKINSVLSRAAEKQGIKLGDVANPMRLWISGLPVSIGVFDLLEVLPWAQVYKRLGKLLGA